MRLEKLEAMISWLLVILLWGCSPVQQFTTQIPFDSPTVIPNLISNTPNPTLTQHLAPTTTNTPVPSPTLRNTPIPVEHLGLEEAKQKMDFLSGSSNCQLPCFNGLTPGISSVWNIQDFFARLGFSDTGNRIVDNNGYLITKDSQGFWNLDPGQGSIYSQVPYLLSSNFSDKPFLAVEWKEGLVTNVNLGPLPYRSWISIPRLYEKLGKPDAIKIALDAGEGNKVAFILHLYFSAHKTYIEYIIRSTSITDVCLNPEVPADVNIAMGAPSLPDFGYDLRNWHELNGMNFDDLVSKIGIGNFCIPILAGK